MSHMNVADISKKWKFVIELAYGMACTPTILLFFYTLVLDLPL